MLATFTSRTFDKYGHEERISKLRDSENADVC